MIKSITVKPENLDESLTLELANPYKTGLAVGSITGLDPGQVTVNTIDLASSDGAYYSNARYSSRNIVIALVVLNNWPADLAEKKIGLTSYYNPIEYNRHTLYKFFPVKRKITFTVENDVRAYQIDGYVESNSVGIFASSQTAQISIICPFPYFRDVSTQINAGTASATSNLFEFKLAKDSAGNTIGWSAGDRKDSSTDPWHADYLYPKAFSAVIEKTVATYTYLGDIDYGFDGAIDITGTTGNITITSESRTKSFIITNSIVNTITGGDIQARDRITFSTVNGNKYLRITRGGKTYNILNSLGSGSSWLRVYPGLNEIEISFQNGTGLGALSISADVFYQGV